MGLPAPRVVRSRPERDACGIGFVAHIEASGRTTSSSGIQILINLAPGRLRLIPRLAAARHHHPDPARVLCARVRQTQVRAAQSWEYGVGMVFRPVDRHQRLICEGVLERVVREEGLSVLGWRDTPIDDAAIGRIARGTRPYIEQVFIQHGPGMDRDALERKLYVVRKRIEAEIAATGLRDKEVFYIPSLSARTVVYKGLLLAPQIALF
jgi:glutamate synthase domain-containing protein 1